MVLRSLRQHYTSTDNGLTYVEKHSFKNEDEIKANGFFPNKWISYTCGICNQYHISKIRRGNGSE